MENETNSFQQKSVTGNLKDTCVPHHNNNTKLCLTKLSLFF